jgi:predicted dehydrogenase
VLFVGAGMVSELHREAIVNSGHLRLVGVLDANQETAWRRAADWNCRAYEDLNTALADPEITAVLVLSPPESHAQIATRCIEAGCHVLVEKPVASRADIDELQRAAGERGVVCMPGHNYAYQPEFGSLLKLVRGGTLGRIRAAWITYVIRHPESVARSYGGVLEEVMIHHTYLALGLFGTPSSIHAGRMEPAWEQLDVEDQAWMTWQYPKGLSVHHFASFAVDDNTSSPWMFMVKVLGDNGSAAYNWHDALFQRPLGSLPFAVPAYEDSYIHEQEAFARAIRGDLGAIRSSLADAAEADRLLELAIAASDGVIAADATTAEARQ